MRCKSWQLQIKFDAWHKPYLFHIDPVLARLALYKGVRDFVASMRHSYHHCLMALNVHNCLRVWNLCDCCDCMRVTFTVNQFPMRLYSRWDACIYIYIYTIYAKDKDWIIASWAVFFCGETFPVGQVNRQDNDEEMHHRKICCLIQSYLFVWCYHICLCNIFIIFFNISHIK